MITKITSTGTTINPQKVEQHLYELKLSSPLFISAYQINNNPTQNN